jgi:plasmid replication initiation protein
LSALQARIHAIKLNAHSDGGQKQLDYFSADLLEFPLKIDQASMECPIFSLSTKQDNKLWRWVSSDGKKSVEVAPGFYGRATIFDKDIIIFCTSQLVAGANSGQKTNRVVRFTARDLLTATQRGTCGHSYLRLRDAFNRLAGTQITTNIQTGKIRAVRGFGIIDSWQIVEKSPGDNRMIAIELKLSDWLFNSINAKEILTINSNYFGLRKPLERRLYEIARKHVGQQSDWEIGVELLRAKCGSTIERIRQFRGALQKIIDDDTLPDYRLTLTKEGKARFYIRDLKKLAKRISHGKPVIKSVDKS